MIQDYDALMDMTPVVMEQSYSGKDSCIYALSVGCGVDPGDDWARQHLGPVPPSRALPAMATVLAAPRLHAMGLGLTMPAVLHGSQAMISHAELPVEGQVTSETRMDGVFDRGEGRGCVINMVRDLRDSQSGIHYTSLFMSFLCRSDQVAGAPPFEVAPSDVMNDRAPDRVWEVPTSTQAAQLFALTGDQNPLHLIPEVAAKAGFPRPILQGVATYGLCAAFVEKALCNEDGAVASGRLGSFSGRFSAPVFPGETLELALWRDEVGARLEARVPARDKVVFTQGRVSIDRSR